MFGKERKEIMEGTLLNWSVEDVPLPFFFNGMV